MARATWRWLSIAEPGRRVPDPRRRLFPRHAAAGPEKSAKTGLRWVEADALHLPFPDASFDLVSTAFGFRNLADYDAGLEEILRVLRPGGECGILDFGEPRGLMGQLYRIYFKRVLPAVGTLLSGVRGPYRYLPASVERFPEPSEMLDRMRRAGFEEASWKPYTFGIAGLYRGKSRREGSGDRLRYAVAAREAKVSSNASSTVKRITFS